VLHCESTFSKNCRARGSWDWPEPEHGLLSNFAIAIVLGDFDQLRDAFFSWQLAEGEYAFFFTSVSGSLSIAR